MKYKAAVILIVLTFWFNAKAQVWQDVGGGITLNLNLIKNDPGIQAMTTDTIHHYLYVGGQFDSAGHKRIRNLARWDGNNWTAVGSFINDTAIFAMCMYNSELVIGCLNGEVIFFDSAGNVLHTFGANASIGALATYNGELYAGGYFWQIDGVNANAIARYNGTKWEPVDSGIQWCCGGSVNALYVWRNKLYAGGAFSKAGDTLANNIASWNDTTWAPLGSGTNRIEGSQINSGYVGGISSYNNNLYVTGAFDSAGGIFSQYIAKWNSLNWISLKNGPNNPVGCAMPFENYLFITGPFDHVGSIKASGIAKWNDTLFSSVNGGVPNSYPVAIDTFNNELYIGGDFDSAGSIAVNNIARWGPDSTTGIKELTINNKQVIVYPNPTTGTTTIISSKNIQYIKVTDLLGQLIYEAQPQQPKFTFDLKETGMYFVTVTSGNEIETKKVVVVR